MIIISYRKALSSCFDADKPQAGDLMDFTFRLGVSRSPKSADLARTVASSTSDVEMYQALNRCRTDWQSGPR